MKTIIIGQNHGGNSAIGVPGYCYEDEFEQSHLCENHKEFWWSCDFGFYFDRIDAKISKSSKEGKKITEAINNNKPRVYMHKMILKMVLGYMSPSKIIELINIIRTDAYQKGKSDKQKEIRKVLFEEN